jgi:hypothetical protein
MHFYTYSIASDSAFSSIINNIIIISSSSSSISIQPLGQFGQEPEPSQATGMALVCCTPGKFLGVVCHCFPPRLDVPTFAARHLHVRNDARDPSSERWNYGLERLSSNFAYMASLFTPLGIFYMPQIYDMGPMALLPLRRKAC